VYNLIDMETHIAISQMSRRRGSPEKGVSRLTRPQGVPKGPNAASRTADKAHAPVGLIAGFADTFPVRHKEAVVGERANQTHKIADICAQQQKWSKRPTGMTVVQKTVVEEQSRMGGASIPANPIKALLQYRPGRIFTLQETTS